MYNSINERKHLEREREREKQIEDIEVENFMHDDSPLFFTLLIYREYYTQPSYWLTSIEHVQLLHHIKL
jgi:hypothetical protein